MRVALALMLAVIAFSVRAAAEPAQAPVKTPQNQVASIPPGVQPGKEEQGGKARFRHKSIMFRQSLVEDVYKVVDAYEAMIKHPGNRRQEVGDNNGDYLIKVLDGLKLGAGAQKSFTYMVPPYIYVDAITSFADGVSFVWVNGKKLKVNEIKDNLRVVAVERNSATIEWIIDDPAVNVAGWQDKIGQREALSNLVSINPKESRVVVRLSPNQHFNKDKMTVSEGAFVAPPKPVEAPPPKVAESNPIKDDSLMTPEEAMDEAKKKVGLAEKLFSPKDNTHLPSLPTVALPSPAK